MPGVDPDFGGLGGGSGRDEEAVDDPLCAVLDLELGRGDEQVDHVGDHPRLHQLVDRRPLARRRRREGGDGGEGEADGEEDVRRGRISRIPHLLVLPLRLPPTLFLK